MSFKVVCVPFRKPFHKTWKALWDTRWKQKKKNHWSGFSKENGKKIGEERKNLDANYFRENSPIFFLSQWKLKFTRKVSFCGRGKTWNFLSLFSFLSLKKTKEKYRQKLECGGREKRIPRKNGSDRLFRFLKPQGHPHRKSENWNSFVLLYQGFFLPLFFTSLVSCTLLFAKWFSAPPLGEKADRNLPHFFSVTPNLLKSRFCLVEKEIEKLLAGRNKKAWREWATFRHFFPFCKWQRLKRVQFETSESLVFTKAGAELIAQGEVEKDRVATTKESKYANVQPRETKKKR